MSDEGNPVVSVKILAYNHAPFIGRCIESALMQRTNFPFEIVIGEDCSIDGTREIVMGYAKKYPEIIRVVTSETNVGMMENGKRTNLACRGEFIAWCEGDDYWIDPLKLQKQYKAIMKHDAVMATHSSVKLFFEGDKLIRSSVDSLQMESGILKMEDLILNISKLHSSSFFIQAKIVNERPDWYYKTLTGGDIPLKLFAASVGKVIYINDVMSIYQSGFSGSWAVANSKKKADDEQWRIRYEKAYLEMYINFDNHTDQKYSREIRQSIQERLEEYLTNYGNLEILALARNQKKRIRIVARLSRAVPHRLRKKIIKKVVDHFMPVVFGLKNLLSITENT